MWNHKSSAPLGSLSKKWMALPVFSKYFQKDYIKEDSSLEKASDLCVQINIDAKTFLTWAKD